MQRLSFSATRTLVCWLLLELVAAAQIQLPQGSLLGSWLRVIGRPVTVSANWVANTTAFFATGLGDVLTLSREVHQLREDLEESRAQNLLLQEELAVLSEARELSLAISSGFQTPTVARCTYRHLGTDRLRFNAGRGHGIEPDSVAVAAAGVVGRVIAVDITGCWVEVITHPASAVAVATEDSSVHGLASGNGDNTLTVEYVPHDASLVRGTLLVSSGADQTYPRGVPVGRVTSVRATGSGFLHVEAEPAADIGSLRVALLIPKRNVPSEGGTPSPQLP